MSRISVALLLTASVVFPYTACKKSGPQPQLRELRQTGSTLATVTFSGLMVFHKEAEGYEVGILIDDHNAPHRHEFSVSVDGVPKNLENFPETGSWHLEVTNPSKGSPDVGPVEVGHQGRFQDIPGGQYDFSWIIDLESSEFHDRPLNLNRGLLNPIIHLTNGRLYTLFETEFLQRARGTATPTDFGFMAETISLNVPLQPDQELVLKVDNTGKEGEVFRLPYDSSRAPYQVAIDNVRDTPSEASDFKLYYALFGDVPVEEQYDFELKQNPRSHPLNPFPHVTPPRALSMSGSSATCCGYPCSQVLLGKRTDPLW